MAKSTDPIIAQWYHYPQKSQKFQVTAIDDHFDTVEVQYFDGTIDEFELTTWYAMEVVNPVGTEMQREDWDAPYDEEMEKTSAGPRISDQDPQESG
jgi:hypothetical protein